MLIGGPFTTPGVNRGTLLIGVRAQGGGYGSGMSDERSDQERVESRAHLLPEEAAAGSDDPQAQADAILAESDLREADRNAAPTPCWNGVPRIRR
ncbi:hypothetical protein Jiend_40460 [Micromonospora endophytica]|nr:hypothetical protein Jiend_40460 [Micromonospora endophytica]